MHNSTNAGPRRVLTRTVASVGLTAGALLLIGVNPAAASTPDAVASSPCTSNYHAGAMSLDMTLVNNTGQTLTLDTSLTGDSGSPQHWGMRPPTTIAAGGCAEITSYTDVPPGIPDPVFLTASYRLPDGSVVPYSAQLEPSEINSNVYTSAGFTNLQTDQMAGVVDKSWALTTTSNTGDIHQHLTIAAGAAAGSGLSGAADHPQADTIVAEGETLSELAADHHVAGGAQALYELNKAVLPDADTIVAGQQLRIDNGSQPPAEIPQVTFSANGKRFAQMSVKHLDGLVLIVKATASGPHISSYDQAEGPARVENQSGATISFTVPQSGSLKVHQLAPGQSLTVA